MSTNSLRNLLVVAAALTRPCGSVLLAERPAHKSLAGKFEFPGGKVEEGEMPEAALARELREELGIGVAAADMEPFWFLSHAYPEFGFHLLMPVWRIRRWEGEPRALEHASLRWERPESMHALPMIEADAALIAELAARP